ncbi:MAG: putative toxin-antitoxin system toxin component, PIN family [Burkholderiales bacterium]|nr:putative toxin-antitoxin system toxin component, PIN family [Burkholderiales bacterium]
MRVVLDTNTVVSALLWGGPPLRLIDMATDERIELYTTEALLAELADVLGRVKFAPRLALARRNAPQLLAQYSGLAQCVEPAGMGKVIATDPDDDAVLACVLAASAALIVTRDAHLLNLKYFHRIPILSAAPALEYILRQARP